MCTSDRVQPGDREARRSQSTITNAVYFGWREFSCIYLIYSSFSEFMEIVLRLHSHLLMPRAWPTRLGALAEFQRIFSRLSQTQRRG